MISKRGLLKGVRKNPRGESTYDSLLEQDEVGGGWGERVNRTDITELHFIAPIVNVPSILEHGILSIKSDMFF